ncbi:hypothetical protein [Lachnobacterium bovis]|uniref:hypothetical protein n=1 Tax=Lachnobacterium bovis TaxID=140626 RepID=UPI00048BD915|nr:hypothetical protein [Lachnobacterium bovis]
MTKDHAEIYVKTKISQINSLKKDLNNNFNDMDLENADVRDKFEELVKDINLKLSKLKDDLETLKFEDV